jgi:hypothetical protein
LTFELVSGQPIETIVCDNVTVGGHAPQGHAHCPLGDVEELPHPDQGPDREGRRVVPEKGAERDGAGAQRSDGRQMTILHCVKGYDACLHQRFDQWLDRRHTSAPRIVTSIVFQQGSDLLSQLKFLHLAAGSHGEGIDDFEAFGNLCHGNAALRSKELGELLQGGDDAGGDHECAGSLAKDPVGHGDYGDSPDVWMGEEVVFDLSSADIAPTPDDDVLQPSCHPEATVLVNAAEVS